MWRYTTGPAGSVSRRTASGRPGRSWRAWPEGKKSLPVPQICAKIGIQRAVLITFVTLSGPLFFCDQERGSVMFSVGELIVYRGAGVCRVEEIGPPPWRSRRSRCRSTSAAAWPPGRRRRAEAAGATVPPCRGGGSCGACSGSASAPLLCADWDGCGAAGTDRPGMPRLHPSEPSQRRCTAGSCCTFGWPG